MRKTLFLFLLFVVLGSVGYAAEWEQVPIRSQSQKNAGLKGGEGMQMVQSIAYASSNPNVIYLCSDTSQVWKSVDGGVSWVMKHKGFYANGGLSIGVDPSNENIVFVAGTVGYPMDRFQPTSPLCGIFKTIDGGENWSLVKQTFYVKRKDGDNGGTFFVFTDKTIYAASYNEGLLKSIDGGDNWVSCGMKDLTIFDIKGDPSNSAIVYVASSQGLYRYDNITASVIKIGSGLPSYPRTIAINLKDATKMYAAVGTYGVYKSLNAGMKFIKSSYGLPSGRNYTHISLSKVNPAYLYVSINENKEHRLNPFYSYNSATSWQAPLTLDKGQLSLFDGNKRYFSAQIEAHPKDLNVAFTAANGEARILKTTDAGKNWAYTDGGYTGGRMGVGNASLAFDKENSLKMAFFLIDFGPVLTENGGDTFRMLPVKETFLTFTSNPVGAIGWGATANVMVAAVGKWDSQLLEISKDNGNSWNIIDGTEDNYKFIAFHPQKQNIIYAQGFKSEDSGKSWKLLAKKIYAVYAENGDMVYTMEAATEGSTVVSRSNDAGATWTVSYPAFPVSMGGVTEIDIDPKNPDRIYAATNFGLAIYDGKKWIKIADANGLTKDYFGSVAIKCVAVDPKHPEVVYVGRYALNNNGQSNGVFRSNDYGMAWENITFNLLDPITIWSVAVSPHDGKVYVGSSHGTWRTSAPY